MEEALSVLAGVALTSFFAETLPPMVLMQIGLVFTAAFRTLFASHTLSNTINHFIPNLFPTKKTIQVYPFALNRENPYHSAMRAFLTHHALDQCSTLTMTPSGLRLCPSSLGGGHSASTTFRGHTVQVTTCPTEEKSGKEDAFMDMNFMVSRESGTGTRTVVEVSSKTAPFSVLKAFLAASVEKYKKVQTDERTMVSHIPNFRSSGRYMTWIQALSRTVKTEKTVFLSRKVRQAFFGEARAFLKSVKSLEEKGVPSTMTFLLHGTYGTGKTSMAKALASTLSIPIYFFPSHASKETYQALFNDLFKTTSIKQEPHIVLFDDVCRMIQSVSPGEKEESKSPFLVLGEDEKDRGEEDCDPMVLRSMLFAFLDGVPEAHNRITVMTANSISILADSEGFMRPGRVDRVIEVPPMGEEAVTEAFEVYYSQSFSPGTFSGVLGKTGAEVFGAMRSNPDPAAALEALMQKGDGILLD